MRVYFKKQQQRLSPPPPEIKEIQNLKLPVPEMSRLDNGIEIFDTRMGTEEVLKIELVFHAGRPFEQKRLVSRVTAQLLKEGTKSFTGAQIAETFDFYGASLSTPVNLDYLSVQVFTLKKHFEKILPLLTEMLTVPTFPQKELGTYLSRSKQKLSVDLSKNDVVAYRVITENIFGSDHFYGFNSTPELFDAITREDTVQHFENLLGYRNCQLFVSGKTDDQILKRLNETVGNQLHEGVKFPVRFEPIPEKPQSVRLPGFGEVQAAIRIGCHLFNRHHPDYCGMFVLNTILGGYFGSRLMSKVREEKGFTYNIGSALDPMRYDGCFYISTEVGNQFLAKAKKEIYAQMELLKKEPVSEGELLMVRRYLLGSMLSMLDGPFNVSETVRTLIAEDTPLSHFDHLEDTIRNITPAELQALAQKYFLREKMWEVVVG